eukprot:TRINITY_DN3471_c0_g1_i2.p4 TRINITY_DN3471_c0_g1~~TRINITY_DN3471_c0_g1_i2.p4  ORF type:complete len:115 (-),score=11.72 TRINITY_DN3471_c0_g1_i2:46-390(-)
MMMRTRLDGGKANTVETSATVATQEIGLLEKWAQRCDSKALSTYPGTNKMKRSGTVQHTQGGISERIHRYTGTIHRKEEEEEKRCDARGKNACAEERWSDVVRRLCIYVDRAAR